MNVGLYVRVSTPRQAKEGDSLDAQRQRLLAFCQQQPDWIISDIYADEGISAKDLDHRPDMLRLLHDCKTGKVDLVMFSDLSRASRSVLDTDELTRFFMTHKIQAKALNFDIDMTTATGRLMLNINASIAQHERERTSERVREVMAFRARRGQWNGGIPPFGYTNKEKQLVLFEEEAVLVRLMFSTYLQTNSIRQTALALNRAGYRTKHGRRWLPTGVQHILRNPVYVGKLRWGRDMSNMLTGQHVTNPDAACIIADGQHTPIVSQETFDRAQALLASHEKPTRSGETTLLRGLLFCGECGRRMSSKTWNNKRRRAYRYYFCPARHALGKEACRMGTIRTDTLNQAVADAIIEKTRHTPLLTDRAAMTAQIEEALQVHALSANIDTLRQQEMTLTAGMARLMDGFEQGLIDAADFRPRYEERKRELAAIRADLLAAEHAETYVAERVADITGALDYLLDFETTWERADQSGRRSLFLSIIEKVTFYADGQVVVLLKTDNPALCNVSDSGYRIQHNTHLQDLPIIHDFFALNVPIIRRRRGM